MGQQEVSMEEAKRSLTPGTVFRSPKGVRGVVIDGRSDHGKALARLSCSVTGCVEEHVREISDWHHSHRCYSHSGARERSKTEPRRQTRTAVKPAFQLRPWDGCDPWPDVIVHCDWSGASDAREKARKRQTVFARRTEAGYRLERSGPYPPRLLEDLLDRARDGAVLAGFDFIIGVPGRYASRVGVAKFAEMLPALGKAAPWTNYFRWSRTVEDVSPHAPLLDWRSGRIPYAERYLQELWNGPRRELRKAAYPSA